MSHSFPVILQLLVGQGHAIWDLNIQTESRELVMEAFSSLVTLVTPGRFSELSICIKPKTDFGTPSLGDWAIISLPSKQQELIKCILSSLRALRIRAAHLELHGISSANLLKLRIESITFDSTLQFKRLLEAISSVSRLQYLYLITLSSRNLDPDSSSDDTASDATSDMASDTLGTYELSISFPNLKVLHLADMWFGDLVLVLQSIVPGDEKLMLSLNEKCLSSDGFGAWVGGGVERLCCVLQCFKTETLMLNVEEHAGWLDEDELLLLLLTVPTLMTLKMCRWPFFRSQLQSLMRPLNRAASEMRDTIHPRIRNLHVYNARIYNEHWFQKVVVSHGNQQVRLGGHLCGALKNDVEIMDGSDIANWLL
ncbi:hypothetical protein B0J17DRAFT_633766 [Rhizoctonia solani]|nr:hypothetical protein B0J17DRAFT_633766 [Rhizoctonia solani]